MNNSPFLIPSVILIIIAIPLVIERIPRTGFMECGPVRHFQMIVRGMLPIDLNGVRGSNLHCSQVKH
jgi:hypothetical protein